MKLHLNDIVTTATEQYVVTGWLHGKEMPNDTVRIERNGKTIYEISKALEALIKMKELIDDEWGKIDEEKHNEWYQTVKQALTSPVVKSTEENVKTKE